MFDRNITQGSERAESARKKESTVVGSILPGVYSIIGNASEDILVDNGIFLLHIIACSVGTTKQKGKPSVES